MCENTAINVITALIQGRGVRKHLHPRLQSLEWITSCWLCPGQQYVAQCTERHPNRPNVLNITAASDFRASKMLALSYVLLPNLWNEHSLYV